MKRDGALAASKQLRRITTGNKRLHEEPQQDLHPVSAAKLMEKRAALWGALLWAEEAPAHTKEPERAAGGDLAVLKQRKKNTSCSFKAAQVIIELDVCTGSWLGMLWGTGGSRVRAGWGYGCRRTS